MTIYNRSNKLAESIQLATKHQMDIDNETKRNPAKLITILGSTATGKTQLAAHLSILLDGEIISADSRQIYRQMDIGTGKDLGEYIINGINIPYHLIDIHDPGYEYNVFEYQHDFFKAYSNIVSQNKPAILCGGSGLYIQAVLEGYNLLRVPPNQQRRSELEEFLDNELEQILNNLTTLHNISDTSSRKRMIRAIEIGEFYKDGQNKDMNKYPPIDSKIFGIFFEREMIRQKITERLKLRLKSGMIKEVEFLLSLGISADKLKYYGLEYKFLTMFITGELTYKEMFDKLNIAIHQFSKRQMTWFRKMEREGFDIKWIDGSLSLESKISLIVNQL